MTLDEFEARATDVSSYGWKCDLYDSTDGDYICYGLLEGLDGSFTPDSISEEGDRCYLTIRLEYIAVVTGLTVAAIETLLVNPGNVLHQNGEISHVIGRPLSEEELIILTIIDGTIQAASRSTTHEDCLGREIEIETDDNNDHPFKDEVDKADIIDALKNPFNDALYIAADGLYYIGVSSGGTWFALRVIEHVGVLKLPTILTNTAFNTGEDVLDYLREQKDAEPYADPCNPNS